VKNIVILFVICYLPVRVVAASDGRYAAF